MPTVAELAKKLELMESTFNDKLVSLTKEIDTQIRRRCKELGLDDGGTLVESVKFLGEKFDEILAKQDELTAANKALKTQNEALEKKVADLEQYSRMNNIEIKGVPLTAGEDCGSILKQMGDVVGCPVSPDDIDTIHRVASRSNEKAIVARFICRDKKNEFVKKARKARLQASQVGFSGGDDRPIFVNDHLTIENKRLFSKALALKKERRWQYLWTENCQIKARQSGDSRVFRIASESDLRIFN